MRIRGLYVVTDARCCYEEGAARVEAALRGGAHMLQLRCKAPHLSWEMARRLVSLGHSFGVPVIVNDDIELALRAGADGVHLGKEDDGIAKARSALGANAIIGVSCYASLVRARAAAQQGADYLAFGSFFPSRTKPHAVRATPDLLEAARSLARPLVAIGGILPENAGPLIAAGASAVAVVDGVFGRDDIAGAARAYQYLFEDKS